MQRLVTDQRRSRRLLAAVSRSALPILSQCFRGTILRDVALNGGSAFLRAALLETGLVNAMGASTTLEEALLAVFWLLNSTYRCDYVYRTAITNKLFLRRYSPATTTLLPELRVWRSKVDLAMFNGTSVAYEIKSDLDNVGRLETQLRDYSEMFDRIFVVTHQGQLTSLRANLAPHVGILVLTDALSFRVERDATSNVDNVRTTTMVDALRREEVLSLTRSVLGALPASTSVGLIDECVRALASRPARDVHSAMVAVLKRRVRLTRADLEAIAPPLVCAYMESGLPARSWPALTARLVTTTMGDLIGGGGHGEVLPVFSRQDV